MAHRLHVIDYYMDGYQPVSFCKVCSAEGDKLFDDCSGPITDQIYCAGLTKEEFEKRFPKASKLLDGSNQDANKALLKTEE